MGLPVLHLHMTLVIFFLLTGWIFLPFLHVKVHTFILNRPPLRLTYLQFLLKSWLSSSGDIFAQFSHRQICLLHLNPFQFETHLDARFWSRSVFRRWWPSSHFESLQVEPAQLYLDYFWKFSVWKTFFIHFRVSVSESHDKVSVWIKTDFYAQANTWIKFSPDTSANQKWSDFVLSLKFLNLAK